MYHQIWHCTFNELECVTLLTKPSKIDATTEMIRNNQSISIYPSNTSTISIPHPTCRGKRGNKWVCLKIYSQWNSHLIGIMISKTIGFRGTTHFQTQIISKSPRRRAGHRIQYQTDASGHDAQQLPRQPRRRLLRRQVEGWPRAAGTVPGWSSQHISTGSPQGFEHIFPLKIANSQGSGEFGALWGVVNGR